MKTMIKASISCLIFLTFLMSMLACEDTIPVTSTTERPHCNDSQGIYIEMSINDTSKLIEEENIQLNLCDYPNLPTLGSNWDKKWHQDLITRHSSIKIPIQDFEIEFEFWSSYIPQEIDFNTPNVIASETFWNHSFRYGHFEEWKEDFVYYGDSIYGLFGGGKDSYARITIRTKDQDFVSKTNRSFTDNSTNLAHNIIINELTALAFEDQSLATTYTHIISGRFNTYLESKEGHTLVLSNGQFRIPINFPAL